MAEFLTDEWLAAVDAIARRSPELATFATEGPIVVEQVVRDVCFAGADAPIDVVYRLTCDARGARVVAAGAASVPDTVPVVRIECDHATAVALARGDANAQQMLARGSWRIAGDLAALGGRAETLGRLGDVFGEVRATTSFPDLAS